MLERDFSHPGYGAVHHLVVAAYMLQHGRYEPDTELEVISFLERTLETAPSDHDRRLIRAAFDGPKRAFRRDPAPPAQPRAWTLTVLDVDDSSAKAYQRTVRAWAAGVADALRQNPREGSPGVRMMP